MKDFKIERINDENNMWWKNNKKYDEWI